MKMKLSVLALALISGIAFTPAARAATTEDVQADVSAVHKDEAALQKHHKNLKHHRARKAAAKANGDVGTQAVESVKIGGVHTAIGAKNVEKNIDENILEEDKENLEAK